MTPSSGPIVRVVPAMGTMASVRLHPSTAALSAEAAVDAFFRELERLEDMFSTYRPTSEISRLSRDEIGLADCSPEVIEVLDACTFLEHASGGAFSIRGGSRGLDPAGYVKGWAAERASRLLDDAGFGDWTVNVGGDVQTNGSPGDGQPWRIAVSHPDRRDAVMAVVPVLGRGAVATSGTAERGAHLWSDRTLDPGLRSVTVTGPSLTWADAYATTVFALGGDEGLTWLAQFPGYEGLALWADGRLDRTSGFPGDVYGVDDAG